MIEDVAWVYCLENNTNGFCFAAAFRSPKIVDMKSITKELPEGVTICKPEMVAGFEHLKGILEQAGQYWKRGHLLARNRSIDLLMRLTCKRQISDAIAASGISKMDSLAIFGLVDGESSIQEAISVLHARFDSLQRMDRLLMLNKAKERYLKTFHKLPSWLSQDQLLVILKEKSVLLVFSK